MQPNLNNPAGRLHAILSDLKSVPGNEQIVTAWEKALKTPTNQLPELLARLGKVYAMPNLIISEMKEVPGYHSRDISRWHQPLSKAFQEAHLKSSWGVVSGHFSDGVLADIESCSEKLSYFRPEPTISESQLTSIRAEFADLKKIIDEAEDVSQDTKKLILKHIERVLKATESIWLEGTGKLVIEVQAAIGEAVSSPEARQSGENRTMRRLGDGLKKVLLILQIWNAANTAGFQLPASSDITPPSALEQEIDEGEAETIEFEDVK